jgi:Mg2+ and Co2+ transporter CorA
LRQLQENYDLHPLAIEDALLAHQLPKLDIYGDQLFVVARPAHLATAKSAMVRPRSSLAIPSSSAFATDRSARIPGSVSS